MELSQEADGSALAESFARGGSGLVATVRGDFEAATRPLVEGLPLFREVEVLGLVAGE